MYKMNILKRAMSNLIDINIDSNYVLEFMHAKFFRLQIHNDKHIFFYSEKIIFLLGFDQFKSHF